MTRSPFKPKQPSVKSRLVDWTDAVREAAEQARVSELARRALSKDCIDEILVMDVAPIQKIKLLLEHHDEGFMHLDECIEAMRLVLELEVTDTTVR